MTTRVLRLAEIEQQYADADDAAEARATRRAERAELARLRDALTAANQEIEILQGELETARQAMGWMVE